MHSARINLKSAYKLLSTSRCLATANPVGFVGLGQMGMNMAWNMNKKGHDLVVYDLSDDAVNQLKKMASDSQCKNSITVASSAADVAKQAKSVITMLPSNPHVKEVYCGKTGLLSGATASHLFVDSSTCDPAVSRAVAAECDTAGAGAAFCDAPVSGGVMAARDGTLAFMVGGAAGAFRRAEPLLAPMAKAVIHCGEAVGSGEAAKICNNMLLAVSMIGVAEALNLGERLGLDPALLTRVINQSSGRCWSSDVNNPVPGLLEGVPAARDYAGGFVTRLMTKDLGLAQDAATAAAASTPLGSLAHQLYRLLCDKGLGDRDFGVVYKYLREAEEGGGAGKGATP